MNYIFLDLEWNQPCGKSETVTEPVYLYGEIIRIGAVKLDNKLNIAEKYHSCVIPKYYKKMNHAVGRVTGLGSGSITYGLRFPAAYRRFMQWCGDVCALFTWGGEDERVLLSNLAVHGISSEGMPEFYDLQRIYAYRFSEDGRQHSLSDALAKCGIPAQLAAHNALNDAVYAAQIAKSINFTDYLNDYDRMLEEAEKLRSERYICTYTDITSAEEALSDRRIMSCRCPVCRRNMKKSKWAYLRDNILICCAQCPAHGEYFVRIKMKLCSNGLYAVTRTVKRLTAEYRELYGRYCTEKRGALQPENDMKNI